VKQTRQDDGAKSHFVMKLRHLVKILLPPTLLNSLRKHTHTHRYDRAYRAPNPKSKVPETRSINDPVLLKASFVKKNYIGVYGKIPSERSC
jgi:hypothetical protein